MTAQVGLLEVVDLDAVSVDPQTLAADTPYVGLEHLATGGGIASYSSIGGSDVASNKFKFDARHVLLGKLRPSLRKVGRPEHAGVCSTDIYPLRPGKRVDRNYLNHFLLHPLVGTWLADRATGANLPRISRSTLSDLQMPLPPLDEQRRIAAMLDRADEFRAKRRRTLALLDESRAALFEEKFSEGAWPLGRVRDLLASSSYGSAKKAGVDGSLPMLRMGNISYEGRLDTRDLKYVDLAANEVEKFTVRRGDVLFNRTNSRERVGKTTLYDLSVSMAYAGYLIRLRVKPEHRPEYLAAFMNTPRTKSVLRTMAKSIVGMANINAQEVGNMKVPIPTREAQDDFAARASSIDHARALAEAHLGSLDELFASLQHRAFTGQLRDAGEPDAPSIPGSIGS